MATEGWRVRLGIVTLGTVLSSASSATAQGPANVLVIANSTSAESVEIAEYYAAKRHIPADQILKLSTPTTDDISRAVFVSDIERPIAAWLSQRAAHDRILYIVLTKGVPLRVDGAAGRTGEVASVDSELTLLYRKLSGVPVPLAGSLPNPYFVGEGDVSQAKPFTHEMQDIYLVARLDGYTVADVKALVDRGAAPSDQGVIVLDGKSELTASPGNKWLQRSAEVLEKIPGWSNRVTLDTSARVLLEQENVLGYYSWGSNDPAILFRSLGLKFVPGALAGLFVSTDARTFREPPATWQTRGVEFAGSKQSLTGDLIRSGVTGAAGHVAEPFLNATIRPDILFPAYLSGFNLVESFYLAMPFVSWQTVVIGDPLCAPFRKKVLTTEEIDRGLDPVTEMPRFISERRVAVLTGAGAKLQSAKLFVKSEVRLSKNDEAGARRVLEEATKFDETLVPAHLTLAALDERASQWDSAIDRYRRVIARAPNQAVALNNLAYSLAVRKKQPAEALPLARRAYAVARGAAPMADTLGWIHHLLGNDVEAERLLAAAAKGAPETAEIQLHAAIVYAGNGKAQLAGEALARAVALDKTLETRDEVKQLREKLARAKS